jgi:hypothetical protein
MSAMVGLTGTSEVQRGHPTLACHRFIAKQRQDTDEKPTQTPS